MNECNRVFVSYRSNCAAIYLSAGHYAAPPGQKPESGDKTQYNPCLKIFRLSSGGLNAANA